MLVKKHFTSRNLQNKNNSFETFEKRKDFLITFFLITKSFSLFLVIASPFLPVIARSEATKQSFTAVRHCEPKGWQVCWREAISPLHIPFSIKCFGVIASLAMTKRKKWLAMTPLSVIARAQPEAISSLLIPVGVRCSGEIASPVCHQDRNDEKGLFSRNGVTKTMLITLQRSFFYISKGNYMIVFDSLTPLHPS